MGGTAVRITPFLTLIALLSLLLQQTEVALAAVGAILSVAQEGKRKIKQKMEEETTQTSGKETGTPPETGRPPTG